MRAETDDLLNALELNAEGCAYWRRELDGVAHAPRMPALSDTDIRSAFEELVEVSRKLHELGQQFEEIVDRLEGDNVAAPKLELCFNGSYLEQVVESMQKQNALSPQRAEWDRRNPAPEKFVQFSRPKGVRSLLAWDRLTAGLGRTPRRIFKRRREWYGEFEDSKGALRTIGEHDLMHGVYDGPNTMEEVDRRWFTSYYEERSEYGDRLWDAISGKTRSGG